MRALSLSRAESLVVSTRVALPRAWGFHPSTGSRDVYAFVWAHSDGIVTTRSVGPDSSRVHARVRASAGRSIGRRRGTPSDGDAIWDARTAS